MSRIRFALVGSGWRSLYYVRIARALPEVFELTGMLCRTVEKAVRLAGEQQIKTTTSPEEIIDAHPDFVVVAVDKMHVAEVALQWLERGFPVLSETPTAMDEDTLNKLWKYHQQGHKLIIAEQYLKYPENVARMKLIERNLIGEPQYLYLSLAHEYHGASLMRAFLHIPCDMTFTVRAEEFSFPTAETLSRYERFTDGRISNKKRVLATFKFANGKTCLYDFDSEQYRSPIRNSLYKLQGVRGEIVNDEVYWLDDGNPCKENLRYQSRHVQYDEPNPNLQCIEEITAITWKEETVYAPPFGLCGLAQDETAMACLLKEMGAYVRGQGGEPYPLKEALQDAYMAVLLREAISSGRTVSSVWQPEALR